MTPRGGSMDDDSVLHELGIALERDDPRLAALLRADPTADARRVLAVPPPQPATPARPTRPEQTTPEQVTPEQATSGRAGTEQAGTEQAGTEDRRRPPGWVLWLG